MRVFLLVMNMNLQIITCLRWISGGTGIFYSRRWVVGPCSQLLRQAASHTHFMVFHICKPCDPVPVPWSSLVASLSFLSHCAQHKVDSHKSLSNGTKWTREENECCCIIHQCLFLFRPLPGLELSNGEYLGGEKIIPAPAAQCEVFWQALTTGSLLLEP